MSRLVIPVCLAVLFAARPAPAELVANGDLESTSGDPLRFTDWDYSGSGALIESASAIAGQYSAEIVAGSNYIGQDFSPLDYFNFGMDFAVFPVGNNRTMHVQLSDGGTIVVQLRVGAGNNLQAYDGSAWRDIAGLPAVQTTPDTGTADVWDGEERVVNSLRVVAYLDAAEPYYNVTLNDNTVQGVTFIRNTGYPINTVRLAGISANSNWLADNVSLIPEPSSAAMFLSFLLLTLIGRHRRSNRHTWWTASLY